MDDDTIEMSGQLNKKFTQRAAGNNIAYNGKLEHTEPEPRHYVDEQFTTADRGKQTVDTTFVPLNENYTSCKSVLGDKSEFDKPLYPKTKNIAVSVFIYINLYIINLIFYI